MKLEEDFRNLDEPLIIRYKAGDPGGKWSTEEVKITRRQIRMMITADLYFSFKFLRSNQIRWRSREDGSG